MEIELHKFYQVTLPSGINKTGKSQISDYLYCIIKERMVTGQNDPNYCKARYWCERNYILPDDWKWQYTVNGKGIYVGTFTRRVSKYVKNTFGFDLSEAELGTIGTMARNNSISEEVVHIDFDDALNWQAGDFGDYYSCYWESNKMALTLLRHYKALAVRVWREDHKSGIGRAWLLPPEVHGLGDYMIVFNGCGGRERRNSYEYDVLWFARLLGVFWGTDYHKVNFYGGDVADNLYGNAYIVGELSTVNNTSSVTLNWKQLPDEECEDDSENYTCCHCDYTSDERDNFITNDDGDVYCADCYNEIYAHCYKCDKEVYVEDAAGIDGDYYCDYHANVYLIRCEHCEEYCRTSDTVEVSTTMLCPYCSQDADIVSQYKGDTND